MRPKVRNKIKTDKVLKDHGNKHVKKLKIKKRDLKLRK